MPDFLPRRDTDLLVWATQFDERINAADYGISPERAAAFTQLRVAFAEAMAKVQPTMRSSVSCTAKDAARDAMKREIRSLKNAVEGSPLNSNVQLIELGFKPKRTGKAAVVAPPTAPPGMSIVAREGWSVAVKLYDVDVARIGRPPGVVSAVLFSFVGEHPPTDIRNWRYVGGTSKLNFEFQFQSTVPIGTQVWLAARWANPTGKFGPAATISTFIAGGGLAAA